MMDEKKRKKLGLSLKASKKLIVEDKEEFKGKLGLQRHNVNNSKVHELKVDAGHHSSPMCEPLCSNNQCENSSSFERREAITDRERLLWKNIFPSNSINWRELEDLPKTGLNSFPTTDEKALASSEITIDGNNEKSNLKGVSENYIDLPKPCIICCTRKPVKLVHPAEEVLQQTEMKSLLLQNKQSASLAYHSLHGNDKNVIDTEKPGKIRSSLDKDDKMYNFGGSNDKRHQNESQKPALGSNTKGFDKKENMRRTSMPNNVVIDLTDDHSEQKTNALYNLQWKKNSNNNFRTFHGSVDKNISKNSHQMHNSHKVINKPSVSSKATARKEQLKCCPMCQLQFSERTSKQEIDNHISCCIGDEVIIDDDSDEDW